MEEEPLRRSRRRVPWTRRMATLMLYYNMERPLQD